MRICTSNINFKANIKFCSPEEFEQNKPPNYNQEHLVNFDKFWRKQQEYKNNHPQEASWPWNIQSIRNEANIVTGRIFTCSAGGVTGVDRHTVATRYHFVPELPNISALKSDSSPIGLELNTRIAEINDENLSAFVVGGDTAILGLKEDSESLFTSIIKFFSRKHIDSTYFWGQNSINDNRGVDAYYTSKDDTWRILKFKPKSNQVVASIEDLENTFTKMHLGKYDKLYFKDTKTPIPAWVFNSKINFRGKTLTKTA